MQNKRHSVSIEKCGSEKANSWTVAVGFTEPAGSLWGNITLLIISLIGFISSETLLHNSLTADEWLAEPIHQLPSGFVSKLQGKAAPVPLPSLTPLQIITHDKTTILIIKSFPSSVIVTITAHRAQYSPRCA